MGNPDPSKDFSGLTYAQVEAMIEARLAATQAQHREEMQAMQDQLDAALKAMQNRGVVTLIPLHAAGFGTEVAETWSQHEQSIAQTGLGMTLVDYLKTLEGVGGEGSGSLLQRFHSLETAVGDVKDVLNTLAESAHTHKNGAGH